LSEIRESIDRRVWLSVYGFRRVGKTSVVNVAVNDQRYIVVKVNLMRLYDPKKRRYSRPDFIRVFLEGVNEAIRRYTLGGRVVRFISNVLGVDEETFLEFNAVKIGMTSLSAFWVGFHRGGLGCYSLCGGYWFCSWVVDEWWVIAPPAHLRQGKQPPFPGALTQAPNTQQNRDLQNPTQ